MNTPRRRIALAFAAVFPIAAHAACASSNGDAIPGPVYDAPALDAGGNPANPDGGNRSDAFTTDDGAIDSPTDASTDSPTDAPNPAPVQINELYVDNDVLGDVAEFVELRAAAGTPADDLKLRILHADGKVKYEVTIGEAGAKFGANGLYVVGGGSTFKLNVTPSRVDHIISVNMWGLDNARGAVQVVRGATLLDVVGYGTDPDAGTLPPPQSPPLATGEGRPAVVPEAPPDPPGPAKPMASSFGRKPGAPDTNDNAADFCAMTASPGYPNVCP